MARVSESGKRRVLVTRSLTSRGSSPATSTFALFLAIVAIGFAVSFAPEQSTTLIVVGIVGLAVTWLIVRNPYRALSVSIFVVMVAWTKFRNRDPMATLSGDVDWQIALELALYALVGIAVLRVWWVGDVARLNGYRIDLVAIAYVILVTASIAWSPLARITTVRAFQIAIQTGLVLAIVRLAGRDGLLRNLSTSILAYVLAFGVIALVVPGARGAQIIEGGLGRFYWFSMHPGSVAAVTAVAGLFLLAKILFPSGDQPRSWLGVPLVVWLPILVLLLLATRIRGQTIAFVAAGSVLFLLRFAKSWAVALGTSVILLIAAVLLSYSLTPEELLIAGEASGNPLIAFLYRGQTASQLTTLSSRTDLWEVAASIIRERPLLGHGFVSSRAVLLREIPWAAYAHNAWVQVLLDLGIAGLVLILTLILSPLRVLNDRPFAGRGPVAPAIVSVTAFLLITSITGEGFAGGPGFESLVLLSLALGASRPAHLAPSEP